MEPVVLLICLLHISSVSEFSCNYVSSELASHIAPLLCRERATFDTGSNGSTYDHKAKEEKGELVCSEESRADAEEIYRITLYPYSIKLCGCSNFQTKPSHNKACFHFVYRIQLLGPEE